MFKTNKLNILLLVLYTMLNSAGVLAILFLIIEIIGGTLTVDYKVPIFYFGVILLSYVLNVVFQKKIIEISNNLIFDNEMNILNALGKARLIDLEQLGTDRVYGILEDLRSLVFIPFLVTASLNSLFILVIGILYFFFISILSALSFLGVVLLLVVFYSFQNKRIQAKSELSRSLNDTYFEFLRDAIDGFKELKINSVKRANLYDTLLNTNRKDAKDLEIEVSRHFLALSLIGQYGLYVIIGAVMFAFPYFGLIDVELTGALVMIILFLSGPINTLVGLQDFIVRTRVAYKRINVFLKDLKGAEGKSINKLENEEFESIQFSQVTHQYSDSSFSTGPIDLTIKKGEAIFVIGGNGSGKSTFIKLLTNLYHPASGSLLLNGQEIGEESQAYRNLFSTIFTNNYLFTRNYDNYSLENNEEYHGLLKEMQLDEVVGKDDDASARRTFSKGQSKRMAMIFALLENREVLVLDEWAADQDPHFRRYFYERLLPRLKKEGKTIIAVTHDDTYFKHADRILKFDYGTIVKDVAVEKETIGTFW